MSDKETTVPIMECDRHEDSLWEGHILCTACGRFWLPPWGSLGIAPEDAVLPPSPPFCACTAVLLPPSGTQFKLGGDPSYSALGVCSGCYRDEAPRSAKYGDGPPTSGNPGDLN